MLVENSQCRARARFIAPAQSATFTNCICELVRQVVGARTTKHIRDFLNQDSLQQLNQSYVLLKRPKVVVGMQQRQPLGDSEGRDEAVDGFSDRDSLLSQRKDENDQKPWAARRCLGLQAADRRQNAVDSVTAPRPRQMNGLMVNSFLYCNISSCKSCLRWL